MNEEDDRAYDIIAEDVEKLDLRRQQRIARAKLSQPSDRDITDKDRQIGGDIQRDLENIFSRANEGMPIYKKLGGISGVVDSLHSNIDKGIKESSVEERREFFGRNALPEEKPITFLQIYRDVWRDKMVILLTGAGILSLILGLTVPEPGESKPDLKTGWVEGFVILISVMITTTVASVNDYRKELKFRKLTDENSAQPVEVIRNGEKKVVDVTDIVVGDLVSIGPGLVMPIDGFYVRGLSVVVDESSVTGENDPKKKNAEAPIFLTGTVVNTAEDAYVLACAVGERSFGGKLLMESRGEGGPRPTPLQERLDDLAEAIGRVSIGTALLLFACLVLFEIARLTSGSADANSRRFLEYFLLCVALLSVAVPEGLPLAVTIALAYSQNKMQDDNNQVRRLRACETMGNATQICSDKTGTLTQNLMSVVQGYIGMQRFSVRHPGDVPEKLVLDKTVQSVVEIVAHGLCINSSSVKHVENVDAEGKPCDAFWAWRVDKGNKTDNALLDFVDRVLMTDADLTNFDSRPHQRVREEYRANGFAIFPFTSDRKRMSAVVRTSAGKLVQHVKGGADQILPLCDRYVAEDGSEQPLTDEMRVKILALVKGLAKDANRNIGVAYATLRDDEMPEEEPFEPLVWAALIGIQDPLRPEVPDAVKKCQMAGVTVRMCTGDNLDTAIAISKQCGIFSRSRGDIAMTGKDFRNLVYDSYGNEERLPKLWPILDRMVIMARSQPLDKQLLVLMLMTRGEVVAVTGDGTNDAPALRLANVGFVMKSGTDIAVKSADIVLLDDNFRSVQRAVVWGRCVNDNIRKFLQLQLLVNVVSVLLVCLGTLLTLGKDSPLTTIQLLWLNIVMDTMAAMAMATEQPNEECLLRGPVHRKAPLVSNRMVVTVLSVAFYHFGITMIMEFFGHKFFDVGGRNTRKHGTLVFNIFVLCSLFHMFNCRKLYRELNIFEGFERSKPFIAIVCACFLFQIVAVETFGEFMHVRPLSFVQWVWCILLSAVMWPLCIASRLISVNEPVFEKEFDPTDLDPDAKRMLVKLTDDIERHAAERSRASGEYLRAGKRLRAQALWQVVRAHHVQGPRIVNAFRRARQDRDMQSSFTKDIYTRLSTTM